MADSVLFRVRVTGEFTKLADLIMQCGQCPWPGRSESRHWADSRAAGAPPPREAARLPPRLHLHTHLIPKIVAKFPHPFNLKKFPRSGAHKWGELANIFPIFLYPDQNFRVCCPVLNVRIPHKNEYLNVFLTSCLGAPELLSVAVHFLPSDSQQLANSILAVITNKGAAMCTRQRQYITLISLQFTVSVAQAHGGAERAELLFCSPPNTAVSAVSAIFHWHK